MRKIFATLVLVLSVFALVACKPTAPEKEDDGKITITFVDGTTELHKTKINKGEKVTAPAAPNKAGHEFVNWFATPSKSHYFPFDEAITEDKTVFAGYAKIQDDTRDWWILGSGTSKHLATSDWGKNITDEHKLTKKAGTNEFSITLDLFAGDEFQFGGPAWIHQRGVGYVLHLEADGEAVFKGSGGGFGDVTAKTRNVSVLKEGNYTLTLTTFPGDDGYNTNATGYTEEKKETYNFGTYDFITWTRNGDALEKPDVVVDLYIKGKHITEWGAQNPVYEMKNNVTKLTRNDEGNVFTKSFYLIEKEEFLFTSTFTVADKVSGGSILVRWNALDDDSKPLFDRDDSYNMVTKAAGLYTFSYNLDTKKLSVTLDDKAALKQGDYYINGTFAKTEEKPTGWAAVSTNAVLPEWRLSKVAEEDFLYEIEVNLVVGDQFMIVGLEPGATGRSSGVIGDYTAKAYTMPHANFDITGSNFKVLVAGTYRVTFNAYSNIITVHAIPA